MRTATLIIAFIVLVAFTGCTSDDDDTPVIPHDPTSEQLQNGPETGRKFFKWSQVGKDRAAAVQFSRSGWCTPQIQSEVAIPSMTGFSVPVGATPVDSLYCTLEVVDTAWTQTEYYPDGVNWLAPVMYWQDSSCVDLEGEDPDSVSFYWYDRETGEFHDVETTYFPEQQVWKAHTSHFSRYILGQKKRVAG